MGEVSRALKKCFIALNIIVALAGAATFTFSVISHAKFNTDEVKNIREEYSFLYAVSAVSIAISFLGIYGSCEEKKWALVVFLILVILGCIGLLLLAVPLAILYPQIESALTNILHLLLPLNNTGAHGKHYLDLLQSKFQCCGLLDGYKDWKNEIPESCFCPPSYNPDECEAIETYSKEITDPIFSFMMTPHPDAGRLVYKERCLQIVLRKANIIFDVTLAILFGLFVLGVLGISLCSAIIHQMRIPQGHKGHIVFISKDQMYKALK